MEKLHHFVHFLPLDQPSNPEGGGRYSETVHLEFTQCAGSLENSLVGSGDSGADNTDCPDRIVPPRRNRLHGGPQVGSLVKIFFRYDDRNPVLESQLRKRRRRVDEPGRRDPGGQEVGSQNPTEALRAEWLTSALATNPGSDRPNSRSDR